MYLLANRNLFVHVADTKESESILQCYTKIQIPLISNKFDLKEIREHHLDYIIFRFL